MGGQGSSTRVSQRFRVKECRNYSMVQTLHQGMETNIMKFSSSFYNFILQELLPYWWENLHRLEEISDIKIHNFYQK